MNALGESNDTIHQSYSFKRLMNSVLGETDYWNWLIYTTHAHTTPTLPYKLLLFYVIYLDVLNSYCNSRSARIFSIEISIAMKYVNSILWSTVVSSTLGNKMIFWMLLVFLCYLNKIKKMLFEFMLVENKEFKNCSFHLMHIIRCLGMGWV